MKNILKIIVLVLSFIFLTSCSDENKFRETEINSQTIKIEENTHPFVTSARELIGVVTEYDTGYYQGGYPPEGKGACTDVIERALFANGYDLKTKIDKDMKNNPSRYLHESDPNINFRRVRNVKTFLDHYAENITTEIGTTTIEEWEPGDIVTYDQIPGSLWHIAIVSNKKNRNGIPLLIHNYGRGVIEDDLLLTWPAPITGHYRFPGFL